MRALPSIRRAPAVALALVVAGLALSACTAASAAAPSGRGAGPGGTPALSPRTSPSQPSQPSESSAPPALSSTTSPTSTTLPGPAPGYVEGRVTVVGDSVTVDAAPALEALIPGCVVDAQVGEQWETGVSVLHQLKASGQLGAVVVVALGTNGPVDGPEFSQMMSVLAGASRVVVVTNHAPDPWEEQNNALFRLELFNYPDLRLADWDAVATAHPQWLYADGTHMPIGGTGARAWAELVKEQI